jgi:hypothetical protein
MTGTLMTGTLMTGTLSFTRRIVTDDADIRDTQRMQIPTEERGRWLEKLLEMNDLLELRMDNTELRDDDAQALARLVAQNPHLQKLDISNNFIGPEGVSAIAEAATNHPALREVNVAHNMLKDKEAGEAVAALMRNIPLLEDLNFCRNMLGDEGSAIVADALADAPRLYRLFAGELNNTKRGVEKIIEAVASHPKLESVNMMQLSHSTAFAGQQYVLDRLPQGENRSMLQFLPQTDEIRAFCDENKQRLNKAAQLLTHELETLTYPQLCELTSRFSSIARNINTVNPPLDTSKKSIDFALQEFPSFVKALPELPADGGADALFTADENGFAPLDNPRLWQNPQGVFAWLEQQGQALDADFLARTTPRGVNFVESALGIAPLKTVLPLLNQQGIRVQDSNLLDAQKQPTPLYSHLLAMGNPAPLFSSENWKGGHASSLRECVAHLPDSQKAAVPVHALAASLRHQHVTGLAHGR